jgi:hypothetical protein
MPKVRFFSATVTYTNADGRVQEEIFPVRSFDYASASQMAVAYILQVLKLPDFEMRMAGA